MDRKEKPKQPRKPADEIETSRSEDAGTTGREETSIVPDDADKLTGAHPRSEVTGRHDPDSGANETEDGLEPADEALRRGAEDTPIGAPEPEVEDLPVFDRGDALPKV